MGTGGGLGQTLAVGLVFAYWMNAHSPRNQYPSMVRHYGSTMARFLAELAGGKGQTAATAGAVQPGWHYSVCSLLRR